jgi:hypothetical protein
MGPDIEVIRQGRLRLEGALDNMGPFWSEHHG